MCSGKIDQFGNELERFNRTEAKAFKPGQRKCAADQIVKARFCMQVAAVGSEVDSRKYYLFVSALDEIADFVQSRIRIDAPASAAD
jgi:hypothetical protein